MGVGLLWECGFVLKSNTKKNTRGNEASVGLRLLLWTEASVVGLRLQLWTEASVGMKLLLWTEASVVMRLLLWTVGIMCSGPFRGGPGTQQVADSHRGNGPHRLEAWRSGPSQANNRRVRRVTNSAPRTRWPRTIIQMCGKEGTLPASRSGTILRRRKSKIQSPTFGAGGGLGGLGAGCSWARWAYWSPFTQISPGA